MDSEKTYRHKWKKHNWRFSTCEKCGCERDKISMNPQYKLNGNTSWEAPNCIPSIKKKSPPKYGKKPRRPEGMSAEEYKKYK